MRAILPIALVCAVVTGSQPGSSQSPQQTEKSPTTVDFQKVATGLTDQIAALRTNHTSLSQLKIVEDRRPEKTWVHFICRHGITGERPNPDWTPHAKVEKNLPVFANDGIELSLYIHVGPYGGARSIPQIVVVRDLSVSIFVRGPRAREVRAKIEEIVAGVRKEHGGEILQQEDALEKK